MRILVRQYLSHFLNKFRIFEKVGYVLAIIAIIYSPGSLSKTGNRLSDLNTSRSNVLDLRYCNAAMNL